MSAPDRWIVSAKVVIRTENDGYEYLRRGAEAVDKELSLEDAVQRHGRTWVESRLRSLLDLMDITRKK